MACFWDTTINCKENCDDGPGPDPDYDFPWELHFIMRRTGGFFSVQADEACGDFLAAVFGETPPDLVEFRGNYNLDSPAPDGIENCADIFGREENYWVEDTIEMFAGGGELSRSIEYFGGSPDNYYNKVTEIRVTTGMVEQTFYGFFIEE